jgi:hypothetical protein
MRPPEGVVIIAQGCASAFPRWPCLFDRNTGKNFSDESRDHKQEAVDDSPLAWQSKSGAREDMHEKADDSNLGQDNCRDIPYLGDPGILSELLVLRPKLVPFRIIRIILAFAVFVICFSVKVQTSFRIPKPITVFAVSTDPTLNSPRDTLKNSNMSIGKEKI